MVIALAIVDAYCTAAFFAFVSGGLIFKEFFFAMLLYEFEIFNETGVPSFLILGTDFLYEFAGEFIAFKTILDLVFHEPVATAFLDKCALFVPGPAAFAFDIALSFGNVSVIC